MVNQLQCASLSLLLVAAWHPCVLASRIFNAATSQADFHDMLVPEPSPQEFLASFDKLDFSAQPYAGQMLEPEGLNPMTDSQKVWTSEYFAKQLREGTQALPKEVVDTAPEAVRSLKAIPPLTDAALFDKERYDAEVLPGLNRGISELSGKVGIEDFVSFLDNTRAYFFMLMNFPRSHFYLGMTDALAIKIARLPTELQVPIEATRMMHPLMDEHSRKKADGRRDAAATFFECLYSKGHAKQLGWDLDEMLKDSECSGDDVKRTLQSMSPMEGFQIHQGDDPAYVLIEGNGRTAGLKAAVDLLKSKHVDFIPPHVTISIFIPGKEKKDLIAMKNLLFFLSLNWKTQFPNVDLKGWRRQEPASIKPVSEELLAVMKASPRYFGYIPA